ncbi:MAG: helix-turn-helix transcriptional regulator [Clostridia bacterium]|nr:helix-turn-helix transcriptional regulator [Clostridia bacterium]
MLRVKELRLENGLTQKEFAEKINSTSKNIWAYENFVAVPPLDVLSRMADFFGCSLDFLTGRSDDFGTINTPALSPDEKKLLDDYRALNTKNRMHVSAYAAIRREEQEDGALKRG